MHPLSIQNLEGTHSNKATLIGGTTRWMIPFAMFLIFFSSQLFWMNPSGQHGHKNQKGSNNAPMSNRNLRAMNTLKLQSSTQTPSNPTQPRLTVNNESVNPPEFQVSFFWVDSNMASLYKAPGHRPGGREACQEETEGLRF